MKLVWFNLFSSLMADAGLKGVFATRWCGRVCLYELRRAEEKNEGPSPFSSSLFTAFVILISKNECRHCTCREQ